MIDDLRHLPPRSLCALLDEALAFCAFAALLIGAVIVLGAA